MTKALVIHPGHAFSTSDVFDGICAGLRANDVAVSTFDWRRIVEIFTGFVVGAASGGVLPEEKLEQAHAFCSWVASADATNMALVDDVDIVVVVNGLHFPPSRIAPLRLLGIPVVCIGTESPYFDATELQVAPFYTHWFTNERASLERFKAVADGGRAFYLPMAWNPERHRKADPDPAFTSDVAFVGGGFPERKQLLDGVNWTGIRKVILGTLWHLDAAKEIGSRDFLRGNRYTDGAIPNEETTRWHQNATIALNLHRRMTTVESGAPLAAGVVTESLGPRAYEIPAVGGFMLCDDERAELFDVYGDSAATFRAWDSTSLERAIRYWLTHPDDRERTQAAQFQAVQSHSWTQRAKTLLEASIP